MITNNIHVELILNYNNNRLEKLIPMFHSMANQNYGKIENNFFIINSNLNVNPNSKEEFLFHHIQKNAQFKGIPVVCYSLKDVKL